MELKFCNNLECEQVNPQPLSNFYSQKKHSKKRGDWIYFNPECKKCTTNRSLKWQSDNPEKFKVNNLKTASNYKNRNREATRLYNKELIENGYFKEWQRNNPEKVKNHSQYRALNKTHEISNKEWEDCKKYFNHRCAYCDIKIEDHYIQHKGKTILGDFHREHVDHSGNNDLSNCVPSCKRCNVRKHTSPLEEWLNINDVGFNQTRLNKVNKWMDADYKFYLDNK